MDAAGVIHHATLHGVDGEYIFRTDEDRAGYLLMLAATVKVYRWRCLAYCQMGTHVHLVIETTEANFSDGMRWLHGRYGATFNRQHGRPGHLFQGRFHDEPILTDAHLINAVRYVALNPVAAGICRHPRDWPWSSHTAVCNNPRHSWLSHDRLLALCDDMIGPGAYERLVETHIGSY